MTYSLDIPADLMAELRDAARDADISAARAFGFGGDTWDVEAPSGIGTGPRTLTPAGTITALTYRQRPAGVAPSAGGVPLLADDWYMLVLDTTTMTTEARQLLPGHVVTSQDDPREVFTVGTVEPWYDSFRCNLERHR